MRKGGVRLTCIIVSAGIFISGCTKEKAEAVKAISERFRMEALSALNQINSIIVQNTQMPAVETDAIANDLDKIPDSLVTDNMLNIIIAEINPQVRIRDSMDILISAMERHYAEFSAIFASLERGYLLAASSVKKAERHAISLTVHMINFAGLLEQYKIGVRANAKRVLLLEQIKLDKSITDSAARKQRMKMSARQIEALASQEANTRAAAIRQCLIAAEIGRRVSDCIHYYDSLSLTDVLTISNQALAFTVEITDRNPHIISLLQKFQDIEKQIRQDKYWSQLL